MPYQEEFTPIPGSDPHLYLKTLELFSAGGIGYAAGLPSGMFAEAALFPPGGNAGHPQRPAPYIPPPDLGGIVTPPGQGFVSTTVLLRPEQPMRVSYSPAPTATAARVDGTGFVVQGENLVGGPLAAATPHGTGPAPFFAGMLTNDREPDVWRPVAQLNQLFEGGVGMTGFPNGPAIKDAQGNSVINQTHTTIWGMQVVLPAPTGDSNHSPILPASLDPIEVNVSRQTQWVEGAQLPVITVVMRRGGLGITQVLLVPRFSIDSLHHLREFDPFTLDDPAHPMQVISGTRHAYGAPAQLDRQSAVPVAKLLPGRVHMDKLIVVPWAADPDSIQGRPLQPRGIRGMITLPPRDLNAAGAVVGVGEYTLDRYGLNGTITGLAPPAVARPNRTATRTDGPSVVSRK